MNVLLLSILALVAPSSAAPHLHSAPKPTGTRAAPFPSSTSSSTGGNGTSGSLGIPTGCLKKNSIAVGWLPDNGLKMSTIDSDLGSKACFFGQYSQITSSTYDDGQLTQVMDDLKASGAIFIPSVMPTLPLSEVTEDVATQVAASMAKFTTQGIEVWLRFAHEMNYYVTDGTYHGSASDFQTAWKNVAGAIQANSDTKGKVSMFWSPNNVGGQTSDLESWWPGPDTVDIVGIDIYPDSGTSFESAYQDFHDTYAKGPDKPFAIGETGSKNSDDDSKQAWLEQVSGASALSSLPKYVGFSWFEYNKDGTDFRVVTWDRDIAKEVLT